MFSYHNYPCTVEFDCGESRYSTKLVNYLYIFDEGAELAKLAQIDGVELYEEFPINDIDKDLYTGYNAMVDSMYEKMQKLGFDFNVVDWCYGKSNGKPNHINEETGEITD